MLDKIAMPWQEQPGEVNLVRQWWLEYTRPNRLHTYSGVEVHV